MTFRVGQKVTLKDDAPWGDPDYPDEIFPEFGVVYTVRGGEIGEGNEYFIWLNEIHNAPHDYDGASGEMNFNEGEFVLVVERKTSIAIFTAMLTKTGVDA